MKIFKTIYYIFIACIAVVAGLLVISVFPITGNYKVMVVLSGSMEPAIKVGSVVVVKPVANYEVGDIITFGPMGKNKMPITHRIAEIKEKEGRMIYVTKGDANDSTDSNEVPKNQIVGKALFSVPYIGYAVDTAKKPLGFAFIIIVPAAIIIFDEVKKIKNEVVRIRNKNKNTNPKGTSGGENI